MSTSKQYAPVSKVPLIKSPSLRTPRPKDIPQDVHPLPDDITAYFVYPFTLEPHVLTLESSRRQTLASHAARTTAYLKSREEEQTRRKREALRRIAPGFEPSGGTLVPTRVSGSRTGASEGVGADAAQVEGTSVERKDVMDDLVDQLVAMDSARANTTSG